MRKNFTVLILMVLFVSAAAFSQEYEEWRFVKEIGPTIAFAHGVTVTPDGCIWYCAYTGNADEGISNGALIILNPDGSKKNVLPGVKWQGEDYTFSPARGISTDCDGNILYSSNDVLYKINYQTYECLGRTVPSAGVALTTAVSDFLGNVVVGFVTTSAGSGYLAYSDDLTYFATVIATGDIVNSYVRDITMSDDGKNLYLGRNSGSRPESGIAHYYSEDGLYGSYTFQKCIGEYGNGTETVQLDRKGRLWIGTQTFAGYSFGGYDCWDLEKNENIGGFWSVQGATSAAEGAFTMVRGLAFSVDGNTAYTCQAASGAIQMWQPGGEISAEQPKAVPEGFELSQNYPNPFNPSTKFTYSVPNASDVKIAVYDLFGREIKTLVNETKAAGTYNVTWNGRDSRNVQAATGIYFYKMQAGSFTKTMKMTLMK